MTKKLFNIFSGCFIPGILCKKTYHVMRNQNWIIFSLFFLIIDLKRVENISISLDICPNTKEISNPTQESKSQVKFSGQNEFRSLSVKYPRTS